MSQRIRLAAAAFGLGGLLAIAVPGAVGPTAADPVDGVASDVSAQRVERGGGGGGGRGGGGGGAARGGGGGGQRVAPQRAAPRPGVRQGQGAVRQGPRPGAQRVGPGPQRVAPGAQRVGPGARPAARVGGARVVVGGRRGAPLRIGGRRVVVVRGPRFVTWRGRRWGLVPIVALGALTIGSVAYAAYGYVPVAAPLCEGVTEDGCLLRWTDVPAADDPSVLVPQCVQYCPQ